MNTIKQMTARIPAALLCAALALVAFAVPARAATDLRVSADGHHLERISDGSPFLLLSDTQWLLNTYSDSQVATILDNRAAKGFTAVQVFATHAFVGSPTLTDNAGRLPFINNDPTQLNAGYWQRWRTICDMAAARGLHFILVMGEPGRLTDTGVPWRFAGNTPAEFARAYSYARQVGAYFATAPNVIFAQGQDSQANGSVMPGIGICFNATGWRAMAEGTADGVNGVNSYNNSADYSTTLMTYHGLERHSAGYTDDISAIFKNDTWIDFYGPEVFHDNAYVYTVVNRDYTATAPVRPSFVMEGSYEDGEETGPPTTPAYIRVEAWHSLLGGRCGYGYGHLNNYNQTGNLAFLNDTGAGHMAQLATFVSQREWWKWQPDSGLITANIGIGATRKVGVKSSAGDECVIYFPVPALGTIKNLLTTDATATWVDPRNGNTSSAGSFTANQTRDLTPPSGWEDALLVLDAAPTGPPPATELLANTGFETGITSWSANGGSVAQITTQQQSGAASCRSYNRTASWCGPKQIIKNALLANGTGNYTVSAWLKLASGSDTGRIQVGVKVAGVWTWFTAEGNIPAGAWGLVTATLPVTWSGTLEDAWFVANTATSSAELYVDNCSLLKDGGTPPPQTVAAPSLSPAGGTYSSVQSVTISSTTSGASIRYTLDGSDPSTTVGTLYTGPVSITASTRLKAVAYVGQTLSGFTIGDYEIQTGGGGPTVVNGSFESGVDGWTIGSSNANPAAYTITNAQGTRDLYYAAAVGTGNAAGNAIFSQTLSTTPGEPYTLTFQYGAFGAASKQQRLLVEVLNGGTVLVSQVMTAYGPGNYLPANTTYQAYSYAFTAGSATTLIRFTDQTTLANSNSCDGMLDAIAVTAVPGSGLPGPWANSDIGTVGVAGTASESSGVFTVEGAGEDIWGTADSFHFVNQTASGDCEITARVSAMENTDPWAKAGVMIRETLNANATFAMTVLTPTNGANQMYRTTTGATCGYTQSTGKAAPYWVRIRRVGNSFTNFVSPDGTTWSQVGTSRSITMGSNVYIGLCVSSHVNSELNTAIFDNVSASP